MQASWAQVGDKFGPSWGQMGQVGVKLGSSCAQDGKQWQDTSKLVDKMASNAFWLEFLEVLGEVRYPLLTHKNILNQ